MNSTMGWEASRLFSYIVYTTSGSSCCSTKCLSFMDDDYKTKCHELFTKKTRHEQRQFILDLMVASCSSNLEDKFKVLMHAITKLTKHNNLIKPLSEMYILFISFDIYVPVNVARKMGL